MRYHGNYCGPNWSAGKYQSSVVSDVVAIDEFDETCKVHDAHYALNHDLDIADQEFVDANLWMGGKRTLAAVAVKTSQLLNRATRNKNSIPVITMTNSTKLRAVPNAHPKNTTKIQQSPAPIRKAQPKSNESSVNAPAAYGTVIRGGAGRQVKTGNGVRIQTTVCLGKPSQNGQTVVPELSTLQYLHPAVLGNDEVQNLTRIYERYRIHSASISFRPFQGTSAGGEIMIVSDADPNYRPINTGVNTSFYQRALTTQHTTIGPLWLPQTLNLAVDTEWKVCDNCNSSTLEDFSSGVVYIYTDGTTAFPGFYMLHLDIEFREMRFNSRQLISGSFQAMGARLSCTIVNPVAAASAILTSTGFTIGDIYAVVLSTTGATFGGILTATNTLSIESATALIPYVMSGSNLVYARALSSTAATMYVTYDAAIGDDRSDALAFQTTAVATVTLPVCIIVQLRNSAQPSL